MWNNIIVFILGIGILVESKSIKQINGYKEIRERFRQQCKNSGNEDKTDEAAEAAKNFIICSNNLGNSDINTKFKRLCENSAQWKTCLYTFDSAIKPCFDLTYVYGAADDFSDRLIDFYCNVDGKNLGDVLSTYSANGTECFFKKTNAVRECHSSASNIEAKNFSDEERCANFDAYISCVVKLLKDCAPTIDNSGEQRFRYLRNSTSCRKVEEHGRIL